jgi:glycosyltransferase involved in cell wall biosynthesis
MKINFCSPINSTGYGIASLNILKELHKISDVTYLPIGKPGLSSQEDYDLIFELFNKKTTCDINAPCFKIWHQFDLFEHFGKGQYIAYPFFELDTFNSYEIKSLSVPDTICVSSAWAKSIVGKHLDTKCHVVPLGVDREIFHENYKKENNDKYIFLNIGKWEVRKGHDILYDLFTQAFPKEKDVELWILASEHTNSYSSTDELSKWKDMYSRDSRIKLFSGVETHRDIAKFIADCDCGLYPSRAEGWNLELLETMSMNKPVIATNYSAHTEFCNKENSYLIDIEQTEKAYDGKAFIGQGNWAKLGQNQIDQTIEYMRFVYTNRVSANPNGINTAKKYSWTNSANEVLRCIKEYI